MNKTATNIHVQVFLCMYAFISLGINYRAIWVYTHSFPLETELLGYMRLAGLTLWKTVFQRFYHFINIYNYIHIYTYNYNYNLQQCLRIQSLHSIIIGLISLSSFSHSNKYEMVSQCIINLCFSSDYWLNNVESLNVEHLFRCLLGCSYNSGSEVLFYFSFSFCQIFFIFGGGGALGKIHPEWIWYHSSSFFVLFPPQSSNT